LYPSCNDLLGNRIHPYHGTVSDVHATHQPATLVRNTASGYLRGLTALTRLPRIPGRRNLSVHQFSTTTAPGGIPRMADLGLARAHARVPGLREAIDSTSNCGTLCGVPGVACTPAPPRPEETYTGVEQPRIRERHAALRDDTVTWDERTIP
jgi:hypothetical protein